MLQYYDPVQCPTQGHTFCRHCILKHMDRSKTCPTCREPLMEEALVPNRVISSVIEDAEVQCLSNMSTKVNLMNDLRNVIYNRNYCDWSGPLKKFASHHDNECQFTIVDCPHVGCDTIWLRSCFPGHMKNCLHRLIACKWCNLRKKVDLLDAHLLTCHKRPVPCPNGCLDINGKVRNFCPSELPPHRALCTMEFIDCKYAMSGCKIKLLKKHMPLHESDDGVHISGLLDALQTAQEKIIESNQFILTAHMKISEQDQILKSQAKIISENSSLFFTAPISQLKRRLEPSTINISGHRFKVALQPSLYNKGWHNLEIECKRYNELPMITNVRADIELVSNSALHNHAESIKKEHIFEAKPGLITIFTNYIETSVLTSDMYVKEGKITLIAKISVTP